MYICVMKIAVINSKGGCGKSTIVLALADVLMGKVVDLDHQSTITDASQITGRHVPVPSGTSCKHLIIDTPPYNNEENLALMEHSDVILVPVKVALPDLLACRAVLYEVRRLGLEKNVC